MTDPAAADPSIWITVASTIISTVIALAVLVFGLIQYKQVARKDYVDELSRRIEKCETDHADCERERTRLTGLTIDLTVESRRLSDRLLRYESSSSTQEPT